AATSIHQHPPRPRRVTPEHHAPALRARPMDARRGVAWCQVVVHLAGMRPVAPRGAAGLMAHRPTGVGRLDAEVGSCPRTTLSVSLVYRRHIVVAALTGEITSAVSTPRGPRPRRPRLATSDASQVGAPRPPPSRASDSPRRRRAPPAAPSSRAH